jgi:hypothetical protein
METLSDKMSVDASGRSEKSRKRQSGLCRPAIRVRNVLSSQALNILR